MSVVPFTGSRVLTRPDGSQYERLLSPATVYTFFDATGQALYVGCTSRRYVRFADHGRKDWWTDVARIEVEHFEHRGDGLRRERHLIRELRPRYNQEHHPDHVERLRQKRVEWRRIERSAA